MYLCSVVLTSNSNILPRTSQLNSQNGLTKRFEIEKKLRNAKDFVF